MSYPITFGAKPYLDENAVKKFGLSFLDECGIDTDEKIKYVNYLKSQPYKIPAFKLIMEKRQEPDADSSYKTFSYKQMLDNFLSKCTGVPKDNYSIETEDVEYYNRWIETLKCHLEDNKPFGEIRAKYQDFKKNYDEKTSKVCNELKDKECSDWFAKETARKIVCFAGADNENKISSVMEKIKSADFTSISLFRSILAEKTGSGSKTILPKPKYTLDEASKILDVKTNLPSDFVKDYVIPNHNTLDEMIERIKKGGEENPEDIDKVLKDAQEKHQKVSNLDQSRGSGNPSPDSVVTPRYEFAEKFGFHFMAKFLDSLHMSIFDSKSTYKVLKDLVPVMEQQKISPLYMDDNETDKFVKVIDEILPYMKGDKEVRFTPNDAIKLYRELKDCEMTGKDLEEISRRVNSDSKPLSVDEIIENSKAEHFNRTFEDKKGILLYDLINDTGWFAAKLCGQGNFLNNQKFYATLDINSIFKDEDSVNDALEKLGYTV